MMDKNLCDDVQMSIMAAADGEAPPLAKGEVESHLAACAACRAHAESMLGVMGRLDECGRRADSHDLWPEVARSIAAPPARHGGESTSVPFVALAAALVAYRLLLASGVGPSAVLKAVAVAAIVAAFLTLRENPFAIKTELRLGSE